MEAERIREIRRLLDGLDQPRAPVDEACPGWQITCIEGGANNLLYRATSVTDDLAIKFCIRDERDRAGREFASLTTLQEAGLDLAPTPLLLDRERYSQPVIVQTWLEGEVLTEPPATEAEWRCQGCWHIFINIDVSFHPVSQFDQMTTLDRLADVLAIEDR